MKSWNFPQLPSSPGKGTRPAVYNSSSGRVEQLSDAGTAQFYVCGITPYDATHIGHAATYLAYDTLNRVLRDAGLAVNYVQNVTDVDDPLLERARATGVDWHELAESQIDLYRSDMEALRVIPPDHYVGVAESVAEIGEACKRLLDAGFAYFVEADLYFDSGAAEQSGLWRLGEVGGYDRQTMLALSAERGGDPDRPGKRDPLDPLLWRAERPGEPSWDSPAGRGRPGWHIECSVIGGMYLGAPIQLNGGGSDLRFPHHEFSAAHSAMLLGRKWSEIYSHSGMVALDGEKMSKSKGNLVFVSRLLEAGRDPRAIRLAILEHHYREDWEWTEAGFALAVQRLEKWTRWASGRDSASEQSGQAGDALLSALRSALSEDLNAPLALGEVDRAIDQGEPASEVSIAAIDSLLGISL